MAEPSTDIPSEPTTPPPSAPPPSETPENDVPASEPAPIDEQAQVRAALVALADFYMLGPPLPSPQQAPMARFQLAVDGLRGE